MCELKLARRAERTGRMIFELKKEEWKDAMAQRE